MSAAITAGPFSQGVMPDSSAADAGGRPPIATRPPFIGAAAPARAPRVHPLLVMFLIMLFLIGLGVWWVTGIFRLGSETAMLRNSFMRSSGAEWKTKIVLNLGSVSFGLVQLGSSFIQMPPEGRAALNSLNQAEVGVYEMTQQSAPLQPGSVLAITDKAMAKRGWIRLVGAVKSGNFVAVYAPKKADLKNRIQASVLVLHENRLVVVGARANPKQVASIHHFFVDCSGDQATPL
jgi:hypothetical protein